MPAAPTAPEPAAAAPVPVPAAIGTPTGTILLVEDEDMVEHIVRLVEAKAAEKA